MFFLFLMENLVGKETERLGRKGVLVRERERERERERGREGEREKERLHI